MNDLFEYVPCAVMGKVSGLRTFTSLAVVSRAAASNSFPVNEPLLGFLRSPKTATALTILAALELIGDKLPSTPSRLKPPGLIARLVSGAICGAAIASAKKKDVRQGAIMGGVGALAGAIGGYQLRRMIVEDADVPDFVVALAEDTIAVGTAMGVAVSVSLATASQDLPASR